MITECLGWPSKERTSDIWHQTRLSRDGENAQKMVLDERLPYKKGVVQNILHTEDNKSLGVCE